MGEPRPPLSAAVGAPHQADRQPGTVRAAGEPGRGNVRNPDPRRAIGRPPAVRVVGSD